MGGVSNIPGTITRSSLGGTISDISGSITNNGGFPILTPAYISNLITYSQSGNLTYFDSTGTLQTAAVDVLPRDYDPSTLVLRGYPFWEQRTNLALWSRDATNAAWTKTNATATLTATGLTGVANSASVLSATAADGLVYQNITVSASTTYTFSVYLKASSATTLTIFIFDPVFATLGSTVCNVTTSWQRFTVTAGTGVNTGIKISIGGGSTFSSGEVVTMDCVNFEAGAFATPAILTTTAAVTRAAPSCAITGTNFSSFWNAAQGSLYVASLQSVTGSSAGLTAIEAGDGTNNNLIQIGTQFGATNFQALVNAGGVGQAAFLQASATTLTKRAFAYAANDFAQSVNGAAVSTDTSGTVPTVNQMGIGIRPNSQGSPLNGWVQNALYYSARLPNSSLQTLSA